MTLTPDTEARLRGIADRRGLTPDAVLSALLAGYEDLVGGVPDPAADLEQSAAGVRQGMADFAAGRSISLEDYRAEVEAEKAARRETKP